MRSLLRRPTTRAAIRLALGGAVLGAACLGAAVTSAQPGAAGNIATAGGRVVPSAARVPDEAIRTAIAREAAAAGLAPARVAELLALYGAGAGAPLWVAPDGHPSEDGTAALALLTSAAADGLRAEDYRAEELARRASAWRQAPPQADALAQWDVALSAALLRYLRELHFGRVDPKALGFRVAPRAADEHDLAAELLAARRERRIAKLADTMAPPTAQYVRLREQLAHYRALPDTDFATPLRISSALKPGDAHLAVGTLRRRLIVLGDLSATDIATSVAVDSNVESPTSEAQPLDDTLVEALRRFQSRHGLEADGVFGRATQAAINVPPSARAQQIEVSMERLRWLPHRAGQAYVAINIPMFRLWATEPGADARTAALDMGVIVGRALKTETPVFSEDLRYLIFRPYWNIPKSILRNEVLPPLLRDPAGYLARHDMEIVRGPGDDATPVPPSAENLAALRAGTLRLRQRPGPRNSLGLIKFIFPNDDAVYLHDTPTPALFERSRRDFSHGCVRVADPVGLAQWLLKDQPTWTRERIVATMQGPRNSLRVDLSGPVPVLLYYVTALVLPPDGRVQFADDLYGHDARLAAALERRRVR